METKKNSNKFPYIISIILFLFLFKFGLLLAEHKPLWNDEIFSQTNVEVRSYAQLFLGKASEGNNCPLFYVLQKAICDLVKYKAPEALIRRQLNGVDAFSQIILRLQPVFFMALSIACIFYYFTRFNSISPK